MDPGERALEHLLRKQLKKFVALVPVVLASGEPEAIHDARVASRRLQQAVSVFFPKPRVDDVKRLCRTPRKVRRALGEWRNCDVLLELVQGRQRRARREVLRTDGPSTGPFVRPTLQVDPAPADEYHTAVACCGW